MSYDNPAGRLYSILEEARTKNPKHRTGDVWAEVLKIDKKNLKELLRQLSILMNLYVQTRTLVSQLTGVNTELMVKRFHILERGFSVINLDAPWETVRQHLDDTTLLNLEFCAHELSRAGHDANVPQDELDKLRHEIERLIDRVLKGSLATRFQQFLIKYLSMLQNAIIDYRLTGVEGLVESIEQALGAMYVHPHAAQDVAASEEGSSFLSILKSGTEILSRAQAAAPGIGYILRVLPGVKDSDWARRLLLEDPKS